ncbi:patatin family protein [Bacillus salitolerans]|uniref:Patatin family protein n=1 Tax=Bacillus salitolerans TaxID=1437434 RepID=A0ABW4LM75_9BACI
MVHAGLVLEGGGMRGVYTSGVLEYFMEQDLYFPYIIGVSAGACSAASYLSRQKGRNKRVNTDHLDNPDYLSYRNYLKKRQLFGMDFIFDEVPNKLDPFDYDTFNKANETFIVGTTDCHSGETIYYNNREHGKDMLQILRASSSLPFVAPIVKYDQRHLLDGGISDPIPIRQAEHDGLTKNVVILTRNRGYYKKPSRNSWLTRKAYRNYPGLLEKLDIRAESYNKTLEYIFSEEKNGNVFILQPTKPLKVGRVERNKTKLIELYEEGYEDAKANYSKLMTWLQS